MTDNQRVETIEARALMATRDPQTYAIIGAAFEVHRALGRGFLEGVYQAALAVELQLQKIPFQKEVDLPVQYKGTLLPCFFRPDFVCFDEIIIETKAVKELTKIEEAQIINYLKVSGFQRGLLINFGAESLEYKRFVRKWTQK